MASLVVGKWMVRFFLWLGVVLAVCLGSVIGCAMLDRYWPPLPGIDDKGLIGTWQGRHMTTDTVVVFKADGTGTTARSLVAVDGSRVDMGTRTFRWGTNDGVFHARYMAIDSWQKPQRPYALSVDGRLLTLEGRSTFLFPSTLERQR